uniref:Transient receptor potential cation channel subfamily C member 2b n=1 Tax=Sinocyclocheilus grahami TaxID=75366 RepID=A0A672L1F3_SINGR
MDSSTFGPHFLIFYFKLMYDIVNKKFRFPAELLGAIREGNVNMVSLLLKTGDGIMCQLDDSEDRLWREALNLSIRLGNEDTMDTLLQGVKFDFRQIHEALLVAVDTNQLRVVKRLLDLEKGSKMDVSSFSMPQYLALEQLCQEFAVELLGMCRNQSQVTTILNSLGDQDEDSEDELDQQVFKEGIPNLARLRLAVNYNQKQFVAQPICQQGLSSIWCGNLSGWRGSRTAWKLLVSFGIFLTMPILCLIYWIAPKSKLGKTRRIPVIKFLLHSASYMWIYIYIYISWKIGRESVLLQDLQLQFSNSVVLNLVKQLFSDSSVKEIWIEGLRSYFLDWWNCLDVMVLSMYLASFALRGVIMLKVHFLCQLPDKQEECVYFTETLRDEWHQEDPQFIAEVLFAVTSMLSFTCLAYILPAHKSLGTLQSSIGKMIDDMKRFMFILVIIGTAFLCGVNNIYVPYRISPNLGRYFMFYPFDKSCRNVINVILIPVCYFLYILEEFLDRSAAAASTVTPLLTTLHLHLWYTSHFSVFQDYSSSSLYIWF